MAKEKLTNMASERLTHCEVPMATRITAPKREDEKMQREAA